MMNLTRPIGNQVSYAIIGSLAGRHLRTSKDKVAAIRAVFVAAATEEVAAMIRSRGAEILEVAYVILMLGSERVRAITG
jgi:hypothetical protein